MEALKAAVAQHEPEWFSEGAERFFGVGERMLFQSTDGQSAFVYEHQDSDTWGWDYHVVTVFGGSDSDNPGKHLDTKKWETWGEAAAFLRQEGCVVND